MSKIVEFIEARITEDEQIAKEACEEGMKVVADWQKAGNWEYRDGAVEGVGITFAIGGDKDVSALQAVHIARHDPARALRQVDILRTLLANAKPELVKDFRPINHDVEDAKNPRLQALAAIWSNHDEFQSEWRLDD